MELSGFMGSFLKISDWLTKFLMTNLVWLLFNFPIVYLLLNMVFVPSSEELHIFILITLVLIPFITFPATTAMFGVVRRWITGNDNGRLIYHFWKFYRENYLRSMMGGVFYTILWVLWIVNYNLAAVEIWSGFFYFYIAITIFLMSFTSYFFADTVHYDLKLFQSLKKALVMAIFHIHYTLGAMGAVAIVAFISYQIHPIVILLFSSSLITYIYFFAYHQIFLRAQDKVE